MISEYRYTEYTYDQRGRLTAFAEISQNAQPTADDIKAHQIRYTYNEDGNLSKVSYPTTKDGLQSLSYIYDENGWLQEIKGELYSKNQTTEKVLRSYTYDAYGKVKEMIYTDLETEKVKEISLQLRDSKGMIRNSICIIKIFREVQRA